MHFLPGEVDMVRQVVVQVGEGDFVLRPDRLSDDDLVDVIELIPVFVPAGDKRFSYGTKHLASTLYWVFRGLNI